MHQCVYVDVLVCKYIHISLIMIYNTITTPALEPYYITFIYVPHGYLLTAAAFLRLFSLVFNLVESLLH